MQFEWLDDVIVLLEEGSLSRAAVRRHVTQPAFSRRIQSFEDWLGTPVLDRKTNSIQISDALISSEGEIRALMTRLHDLRTKIAHYEKSRLAVTLAAQHAPLCSAFPDMALRAKGLLPNLQFRLRAGNLNECVSLFLRGDASMLLCYEAENIGQLQFGSEIRRGIWGNDFLIPVVGGTLRYAVTDFGEVPENTPAIVYPEESYFGEILRKNDRPFGVPSSSGNIFGTSAFSSSTRELIIKGLGIGWLPYSMAHQEIESGALISLSNRYGKEALQVAIYAYKSVKAANVLSEIWTTTG